MEKGVGVGNRGLGSGKGLGLPEGQHTLLDLVVGAEVGPIPVS